MENGVIKNGTCGESGEIKSLEEPLVGMDVKEKSRSPWKKLVVLIMVWFSFFLIYLLRGNRYGQVLVSSSDLSFEILHAFSIHLFLFHYYDYMSFNKLNLYWQSNTLGYVSVTILH